MTSPRLRLVVTCLTLVGLIACGPAGPTGPGTETLAGLRLAVVDATPSEAATTVAVTAIGSRGSDPLTSFAGTATLELDVGAVTPGSVALTNGSGSAEVVVGGHVGTVTLTARIGSVSTSATIDLQPIGSVPGDPAANAADALPWIPFVGREEDYRDDAPDVPGLMLSFRAAGAVLHEDATIGQLNDLLSRYGAGIAGFGPGLPGQFGPTLSLWLPTADPTAMAAAIAALREEPLLDHVHRRFLLEPYEALPESEPEIAIAAVGPTGEDSLATWTWEREDQPQPESDANWGYERIRVPQMWNLNGGAEVASRAQRAEPWVAIIDGSALYDHPDLRLTAGPFSMATTLPNTADAAASNDHATHVGGTIAATFDNREGIEGINPFANLMHQPATPTSSDYGLMTLMVQADRIRVVNLSGGIPWKSGTINPNTSATKQQEVTAAGGELAHVLAVRRASGNPVPIIVASAGNDSNHPNLGGAVIEARWNSTIANAALVHGDPGILVVEAVGRDGSGTIARAAFSNAGGHVSAPGVAIVSTGATQPYPPKNGTSYAAPHVTGVASYLLALRPEATHEQVIRAILETAEPVAGAAPLIDAFAAAMALDAILGGHPHALHALLDVDDGTLDGNLRVDPFTGGEVPHEQDAFGPRGDGVIDMRDFRRFRDALLLVEGDVALDLDGSAFHPKRDLDLDGFVATPAEENVFPRFDFNGDGLISRKATAFVGGTLQAELTDLQVLQAVWQDPMVDADALPALLDSGDVHVDLDDAFFELGAVAAEVTFTHVESESVVATVALEALRQHVTTLPVGAYDVDVTYFGAGGASLATGADRVAVGLGGDVAARLDPRRLAAPTNLAATTGNASLAIAFTLPDDDGSPFTTLEYSFDGTTWSEAATTTSPLQLAGLTNEEPVTVRLRVRNAAGSGPASDPITATPTLWPFATRADGTGFDVATGVSALADGSAIITGYFQGSATFGATTLTSAGSNDVFVAKTNADGSWAWATRAGGTTTMFSNGVSALADGSAIITGYFRGTATFGATTLTSDVSSSVAFVAKTNPDGSWAWATSAGGAEPGLGSHAVSTLSDGSAIITGRFYTSATFGGTTVTSAGAEEVFVAKINPNGSWAWAKSAGGSSVDYSWGVSALPDGSAIITGRFRGSATFGGTTLTSAEAADEDVFVAKIGTNGNWAWATSAGGTTGDSGHGVSALADGSAIITGYFQGTATFGANTINGAGLAVFVAKTNPDGTWAWANSVGGSGFNQGLGTTTLADGSAIITGYFTSTATFGATTLTSAGSGDVFVAKTNPDGSWAWATSAGGPNGDRASSASVLADGSVIIAGYFQGTAATFGATTLTGAGSNNMFVAKVSTNSAW